MPEQPMLIVNGTEYPIPDDFTLGELADIERITGQGYDLSKGGILGTMAMIYVALHRSDNTITVDDIRALGPDDFEFKGAAAEPPLSPTASDDEPTRSEQPGSDDGQTGSESSPDSDLNGIGDPTSVTNAMSASVTSST